MQDGEWVRVAVCTAARAAPSPIADVTMADGIRVTVGPLTVLEVAALLPDGAAFLDRALQRHVRCAAVYRAYCRNLGARGSQRAGELLVAAADRADSAAERRLIALLRGAGTSGFTRALPFARGRSISASRT
ncbi:MAG: hypothetical protein AB7J32_11540 [Pseudonocardia sp.]